MKIRIFKRLVDGVFEVLIGTEDWSANDKMLMVKLGEPEISIGGTFYYSPEDSTSSEGSSYRYVTATVDDIHVRIMTESPIVYKFDYRDYGSIDNAKGLAQKWSSAIESRIISAVTELRSKDNFFTTEEITEY